MIHQWVAPAKLNLFLHITGQRADGYHLLQTLFQFLNYGNTLHITPTINGCIRLLSSVTGIKKKDNLIVRAAKLLQYYCFLPKNQLILGADISLNKILPIGGGLGSGSSEAATVLIALNTYWNCGFSIKTLAQLGLMLGADVPVFIHGKAAFAEGIGEQLTSVFPPEKWYLVAMPPVSISTSQIFNDPELQRNTPIRSLSQLMRFPFKNDCEPIVRKRFFTVEQHISWLLEYAPSRLTGTGACVFAEFDTEAAARQVLWKAPIWMRGFVAQGVNTSPLHNMLNGVISNSTAV